MSIFVDTAYGHDLYDKAPPGLFQVKWDWDPTLIFFLLLSIAYLYGLKKFGARKPVKNWQVALFFTGISVNIVALLPPIDPLSDQLFFVHMIQHLMITSIGVPLMLFGVPFFVVIRGMPMWVRRYIYFPFLRNRLLMLPFYLLNFPIIALIFYVGMMLLWHVPLFYNLALFNDYFHLLEHACFAFSAIFMWRNIIAPHPLRSPLPLPARLLFLAIMEAANISLSATLTFTSRVLYGYEGIPQPGWWRFGYLTDQQLGGLIMWVPGGFINYFAMTVCFFVWVSHEQAKEKEKKRLAKLAASST